MKTPQAHLQHYNAVRKALEGRTDVPLLTLSKAQGLSRSARLYHAYERNADGTAMRVKVTSVRTWKTRPSEVLVTAKYGYKSMYYRIDETSLENWALVDITREPYNVP